MAPLSRTEVENDTRAVSRVRVVVHTLGPAGPTTSDMVHLSHSCKQYRLGSGEHGCRIRRSYWALGLDSSPVSIHEVRLEKLGL